MSEKEIVDSRSMTIQLILGYVLFVIVFSIIYYVTVGIVVNFIPSVILKILIGLLGKGILLYVIWRITISLAFKKKTIEKRNIPIVAKNITIFVLLVFSISFLVTFGQFTEQVKQLNEKPAKVLFYEENLRQSGLEEDLEEFQAEYQKQVEDQKDRSRGTFYGTEVGMLIIHLVILMFVRRRIADQAERKVLHAVVSPEEFVQNMEKEKNEKEVSGNKEEHKKD